jgi:hypothetical protein
MMGSTDEVDEIDPNEVNLRTDNINGTRAWGMPISRLATTGG